LIAGLSLLLAAVALPGDGSARADRAESPAANDVAVFEGGHRTPVLVRTKQGTTLLFATLRGGGDLGPHSLVVRRSEDDGRTWGESVMIANGRKEKIRCAQPAAVADRPTGDIYLFYTRGLDIYRAAKDPCALRFTYSEDDGETWAEPIDPCRSERFPNDLPTRLSAVISHGIQLNSGRLLMPCSHVGVNRSFHHPGCLLSDDHGKTWKFSNTVPGGGALEYCVLELADGSVYMNMRNRSVWQAGAVKSRKTSVSRDGGLTWSKATVDQHLLGPVACNSVVRLTHEEQDDRNRILYAGPFAGGASNRQDLKVWLSYDEGKTWKPEHGKLLVEGDASYSDMIVFPDKTVGIAYETHRPRWQAIRFARFTLEWLTDGKDQINPGK
jgi:sialidase-1